MRKGTDIPLPKGWEVKKLGEVCDILDSLRKPITKRDRIEGEYPYYGATGILSHINNFIFNEPLVLIGEDGAKWGPSEKTAFIATGKYWVNNHAHVIRPHRKNISDLWLIYYLNYSDLMPFVTGMTVPKLNQEKLRSIPIPLPPLPEQHRIVVMLDKCFEAIEKAKSNAERNLQNAKELFESYLNGVFDDLMKDIELTKLSNYLKLITYGFTNPMPTSSEGPYMITAKNVNNGIVDYDNARRTTQDAFDNSITDKSRPKMGDVLLTKDGTLGRLGVVEKENSCINQSVALLRPNENLTPYYLKTLLSCPFYQKLMIEQAGGATIKHIYITRVEKMLVPVPPLKQQQTIVQKLDDLKAQTKKLEKLYKQKIDDLNEFKKSILQKAFNGELVTDTIEIPS